ncbi:MAG: DnaJ domain-containing protein [Pseudomonadales bacterium]|nr:DnaJ domain-containing protein [Pseudomonadales bacterium]
MNVPHPCRDNPLIMPILAYLQGLFVDNRTATLIDLINICEAQFDSLIVAESLEDKLFQKNFLIMNALYNIQQACAEDGFYLVVSAMEVRLIIAGQKAQKENCASHESAQNALSNKTGSALSNLSAVDVELAAYYLDWENLDNITHSEIQFLLDSFWHKYNANQDALAGKNLAALHLLGLGKSATWLQIKASYRREVTRCHPDKGGDAARFIAIRAAYEQLYIQYRNSAKKVD